MQTHNRGDGHSAVAGAAYRLGLRLYGRRNKQLFDFRKRMDGDEVVFQTTIAPPGAPEWATDPEELWNRVEQAERRRDAQVARDYRVSLPLKFNDQQLDAMALEIARHIATKLTTPVSVAIHRDAAVSALGVVKADVGAHAHLYFPTRKIVRDAEAVTDGKTGGTGMGTKHSFLSNKSTSGDFVEQLNRFWAESANRHALDAGLEADYDHRSYRRAGLKNPPTAAPGSSRHRHGTQRTSHAPRGARARGRCHGGGVSKSRPSQTCAAWSKAQTGADILQRTLGRRSRLR